MVLKPSKRWKKYSTGKKVFNPTLQELKKAGKDVLKLTGGDPVIHGFVGEPINEYLIEAVKGNWHMYPQGSPWPARAKKAIAEFEGKTRGVTYSPENVLLAPGCANALYVLHNALLDPGDEVVAPDPSHYLGGPTSYFTNFGAKAVPFKSIEEDNWTPNIDDLQRKITDRTKAIFINNPNNPAAVIYEDRILKEMVDIAGEHNLLLIGDEIYGLITFDGKKSSTITKYAGDVPSIVMSGVSKYFMRTGWRLGYLCLHDPAEKAPELMNAVRSSSSAYGMSDRGIPTPILAATALAIEDSPLKESLEMVDELQKRRDYIMKRIDEIEGMSCAKPEATLYAFPKIDLIPSVWKSDVEFLVDFLREEQVLFKEGSSYGQQANAHFRTLLMPDLETQKTVFDKFERFIKKHS
jgi:aspartate/methionine/tyrosine aminotransferase